jgi:2-C-methyl-D-erythritol 4-phosphate cytidylyltransferase
MHKVVVIAAGGNGSRMGAEMPKQFLPIHDKPIICHTIAKFIEAYADIEIIIAISPNYEMEMTTLMKDHFSAANYSIIHGGVTRFQSVQNGVNAITTNDAVVFVHDAARCMISVDLIKHCYEATIEKGSAVPSIRPSDSLRLVENNRNRIIDRSNIRIIQTPQTFFYKDLKVAFAQVYQDSFTDEASVVEQTGIAINLVEGDIKNIKITHPFDLEIAKMILGAKV